MVGTTTPIGTAYGGYSTDIFTATPGVHPITLAGLNLLGGDNTAFIDQVAIVAV